MRPTDDFTDINSSEAKAKWSSLVRQVQKGKKFRILHNGQVAGVFMTEAEHAKTNASALTLLQKYWATKPPSATSQELIDWKNEGRR